MQILADDDYFALPDDVDATWESDLEDRDEQRLLARVDGAGAELIDLGMLALAADRPWRAA